MRPTIDLKTLLAVAKCVGIYVNNAQVESANLYAWTDPDDTVLYIGKAASSRRLFNESRWVHTLDHTASLTSGFVALIRENCGTYRPLHFES